jgi:lactoylglutathione lyase
MYLDYSGIRVKDLSRSTRFYTKALGLKEKRRGTMWHGGIWVLLEDPKSRQRLELNWYPRGSKYCTRYSVGEGLDHIGVRVPDVKAAVKRLVGAGGKLVAKPWEEKGVPVVAYLRDPNGIWIELILTKGA